MERPLVVVTGQGISRADGLDLEQRLRDAPEPEVRHCFGLPRGGETLDDVFSAARAHSMDYLEQLVVVTRRICIAARTSGLHAHHREVFRALQDAAADRVVLHLTTNIDGIATTVAVRDFGAIWRPVQRYGEEIPLEDIRRDVRDAFLGGRGLLHLPVHGEAGLAAVRGRPEWEGAHRLLQADLRPVDAYSTVGQGIGQQVREIENLMAVSKLGYGLLLGLLVGDAIDVDGPVGPYPPADLLAVGYGAGGTPGRADYPFERKIDEAGKRGHPSTGATWRALVYRGTSADVVRTAGWYAARGVEVIRYGDGELGTLVKTATP